MKKILSFVLVGMMVMGTTVLAESEPVPVPVLIENNDNSKPLDSFEPVLYTLSESATYEGTEIVSDVAIQNVNGVTMIPLRATLEAMGYTVTWNSENQSVEIQKGPQWTAIYIGENAYFRNRMAAHELSSAPVIVDNRTLVPLEFFADIIGKGIEVDSQKINFLDGESIIHTGFIKSIEMDETGTKTLTLTSDMSSDSFELQVNIYTSAAYTFFNREVKEGDLVQVVGSQFMTMSLPGQTAGYVVY